MTPSGKMIVVAKSDVLARVEADLVRGHTHLAMQRLASLTAMYPDDMDLRARRAALNRRIGNLAEAGRWGYLTEDATPAEITAFERAHRSLWMRLRTLQLTTDPAVLRLGPLATQRLATLVEQAGTESATPLLWTDTGLRRQQASGSWRDNLPCLAAAVLGVVLVTLMAVGLVTVVRYLVR
jgi:hypothetical protein